MVTISLLVLLSLLAVGLLSLSTISLRASSRGAAQAEARANARLALTLAIGQLQKQLGPDTRVSANANQANADSPHPHWVASYPTREGENFSSGDAGVHAVGHHDSNRYLSDLRASSNEPARPTWLVSSPDPGSVSPDTPGDDSYVTVVDSDDATAEVRVPRVNTETGAIAWWTSDESQKARVNLADPGNDRPGREPFSLVASQDFDFETYQPGGGDAPPLAGLDATPSALRDALPTLASTGLTPIADPEGFNQSIEQSIHHLTADSIGLFTDTRQSGLRKDLSTFLAKGDISDDPRSGEPGLRGSDPILPGEHHQSTSPRFSILKGWADLADQLSSESGPASIRPQPPTTRYLEAPNSAPGHVRDLTQVTVPAIQPVVVEASLGWDFSPWSADGETTEFVRAHIMPRLTLWNPYNVTLEPTQYLVLLRHPLYGSFTARGERVNSRGDRFFFGDACGDPESAFLGFVTNPTPLAPGETRIFTPDIENSGGAKLFGHAAQFDPRDYGSNVLTSEQIPGIENFHYDTRIPLPAEQQTNRFSPYGFSSNMNSFYSTPAHSDEFLVIQLPEGGNGRLNWSRVTADNPDYPRVGHFICQNWGLKRYHKWYGAETNAHPSNNGTPFREFRPGAEGIGSLENRRPPRLWRRGVRMAWFDDDAEYDATGRKVSRVRFTHPWFAASNVRGGMLHHPSWATIPYAPGWQWPWMDGHSYFQQPTDPQKISTFFPPAPLAAPDDGFPTRASIYDVPRRTPGIISLGQLQHAQLSYSTWHPSFVIGHSQPTTNADLDATAIRDKAEDSQRWQGDRDWNYDPLIQAGGGPGTHDDELLVYDLAFEANFALFDRFMLSSIPFSSGRVAWNPEEPLPVGRYRPLSSSIAGDPDELQEQLSSSGDFPYHHAAAFLGNHGAFNVNSTSIAAWQALLGTLRDQSRTSLDGQPSEGDHPHSRSVNPLQAGVTAIRRPEDDAAWNGFRSLSDNDIADLSRGIVEEVRRRGPFLSLADFVNRRLDESELGKSGALDAAIADARNINSRLERAGRTESRASAEVPTGANRPSAILHGIPGFLTQGDLLNALAPAITVRGDTFRIRCHGEASLPDGSTVVARCEAIVQRTVDYVDPADPPTKPAITSTGIESRVNDLSPSSLTFGRRFVIQSFRWLPNQTSTS